MWEMAGFFPALSHPSLKLFFRLAQAQFPDSRFHKRTAFIKFLSVWGLDARIQQGAGDRERAIITRALPQLRWQQNPAVFSGEVSGEQTERERERERAFPGNVCAHSSAACTAPEGYYGLGNRIALE